MIYRVFLSILLLASLNSLAWNGSEVDSLYKVLAHSENQLERAQLHSRIGWLSITSSPDKAEAHLDTALNIYNSLADSSGIANSHYRFGVLYRVLGEYSKASNEIDFYLDHVTLQKDTFKIVNGLYQKGVIYSLEGRYEESASEYFKILDVYEELNDSVSIGFTLNSIGIVLKNLRKFDEAEAYLLRASEIHSKLDDTENLANTYNSLANLYAEQGEHSKAENFYQQALTIDRELGIVWGVAMNSMNIGALLIVKGKAQDALPFLLDAKRIQEENGFEKDLAETYTKLGYAYLALNDLDESQNYINNARAINVSSLPLRRDLFQYQSQIYEKKGMYKDALAAHKKELALRDSIFNIENTRNINALAARYDSDFKDRELQSRATQIQDQEAIIDRNKREILFTSLGIALAVSLLIVIWMVYSQRQKLKDQEIQNLLKQKEITSLEAFIQGEENERKRIAQDLHDGLNGDLSIIKYKVSSFDDPSRLNEIQKETIGLIDRACQQVRSISHNLAPPVLKDFDLNQALKEYIQQQLHSSDIDIQYQSYGAQTNLDSNKETIIFRMIQEMLNNLIKHADASEALVQLNWFEDRLNIIVEDNGKGFNINDASKGIGLRTIESRVKFLRAELDFESSGEGTSYSVSIPIDNVKET